MKFAAGTALFGQAAAHCTLLAQSPALEIFLLTFIDRWDQLNSNTVWEYVRESTNNNSPVTDLTSNDLRCNVGGANGTGVATASIAAGSTVTFSLDQAIYHVGECLSWPVQYLNHSQSSRADVLLYEQGSNHCCCL